MDSPHEWLATVVEAAAAAAVGVEREHDLPQQQQQQRLAHSLLKTYYLTIRIRPAEMREHTTSMCCGQAASRLLGTTTATERSATFGANILRASRSPCQVSYTNCLSDI